MVDGVGLINEVNRHQAQLVLWMGDCLRVGKPSRYVTIRSNRPSMPPGLVKRGPALAGKAKAWFIPFTDKCVDMQVTV